MTRSGYRVLVARNGEEALKVFKQKKNRVDLIVLDLNMPGMGGRMALKELLRLDPGVRVIIATGFLNQDEIGTMLDSGARDFIAKPYKMTSLIKSLRSILDGPPKPDYGFSIRTPEEPRLSSRDPDADSYRRR